MVKITQGRRVSDDTPYAEMRPGDYCREVWRPFGRWIVCDPSGVVGGVNPKVHTITEHEDGTITLSPSFVGLQGWHGFLERGVWREC